MCVASNGDWAPWTYDLDAIFGDGELRVLPPCNGVGRDHICDVRHRLQPIEMVPIADGFRYLGVQYSPSLDPDISADAISDRHCR